MVVKKFYIFWYITPCSLLIVNRHFGGIYGPFFRVEVAYSLSLKMKATWSFVAVAVVY
jgi:hypothetical protein